MKTVYKELETLGLQFEIETLPASVLALPVKRTRQYHSLGKCKWRPGKPISITISSYLDPNSDDYRDTLLHEIAHAWDVVKRGRTDHSKPWQLLAVILGAVPSPVGQISAENRERFVSAQKVVGACLACGTEFRRLRRFRRDKSYRCGCGGVVVKS